MNFGILSLLTNDHIQNNKMFRSKPPIPQPARPSEATNEANYLSAHVQQILAMVLPQPVVQILAAISDALYRAVLGQSNDPPTYTSTLAPPAILIGVTYLAILLVYKSVRSFIGMLIFSLKWAVILGVIGVLVAYHYGNGDVQQGAQSLAHQTGLSSSSWPNMLRNYQSVQQFAPLLSNLGLYNSNAARDSSSNAWASSSNAGYFGGSSSGKGNDHVREYRDLRPSNNVGDVQSPYNNFRSGSPSTANQPNTNTDDLINRFSRWMGSDQVGAGKKKA